MKHYLLTLVMLVTAGCTATESPPAPVNDWRHGAIVAAANPHAVDAAAEMLQRGGHAVDAAIAAHLVLGLVEPQSSGIGGGGFMLVYQRGDGRLRFHDGRETAPAGATVDMFMRDGEVMKFLEAWQSGLAVGVPGVVALYHQVHDEYGRRPWPELFQPAIQLAEEGFAVSPRLAGFLPRLARFSRLDDNPVSAAYFYPAGKPLEVGQLLKNPAYARTLRRIAAEGPAAFYSGEIAAAMVRAVAAEPDPGTLSLDDLAGYRAVERDAVCGEFRDNRICTTTPPSSGGAQIMIAGLYEQLLPAEPGDGDRLRAFVDAQRLAYADRDHYFGDPDAVRIPLRELLHPDYLRHRAGQRFEPGAAPTHGDPFAVLDGSVPPGWSADTTQEVPGTTHLSIVDGEGNAVAMTATVEAPFGSSRMVEGFLLNNQMTDFARKVAVDGKPHANAIAPGRRPRSSMSPTMVFDANGDLLMVTGSPGGNSIPAYVSKSILGVLDWGLSAGEAVDYPNIVARGEKVRVEVSVEPGGAIADELDALGYQVQEREGENSGLHVIVVGPDGLDGAADPRREGNVRRLAPAD